jgi:trimethylguanosine synthase
LPNGDCGDGITNPYPKNEVPDKFWSQRRRLFTRFDEGIQLDKESWYSVTPESIANHIAGRLAADREKMVVLDPFCGCGGNAIAIALRDEVQLVVCVDSDVEKLKKAVKNASTYGVAKEKMVFVHSDALEVIDHFEDGKRVKTSSSENAVVKESGFQIGGRDLLPEKIDAIFLSPPWGGMDYVKVGKRNYTLDCIKIKSNNGPEVDGETLLKRSSKGVGSNPIILFLPRNINGVKLGESAIKAGYEGPIILEQNVLNGKLKTVTAYLGL